MVCGYFGVAFFLFGVQKVVIPVLGYTSSYFGNCRLGDRRQHVCQGFCFQSQIRAREFLSLLALHETPSTSNENNIQGDKPVEEENTDPVQQQPTGGSNLILEMARKFLTWDSDFDNGEENGSNYDGSALTKAQRVRTFEQEMMEQYADQSYYKTATEPRWRPDTLQSPTDFIANENRDFRDESPKMTAKGYARVIRKYSRKRQPSMWRYALRMYKELKKKDEREQKLMLYLLENGGDHMRSRKLNMRRENIHFESVLVVCSKLGLWEDALEIYNEIEKISLKGKERKKDVIKRRYVTDNMVLSTVSACVRASRGMKMSNEIEPESRAIEEAEFRRNRKLPLDAARDLLFRAEENHGIPIVSRHINPLASAYLSCGFLMESEDLLRSTLSEVSDADATNPGRFNVNDIKAKNEASYALLVKGAVSKDDWSSAVGTLRDMTERGVYPGTRSLNSWQEAAKRKERSLNFFRRSNNKKRKSRGGGWRKKRDEIFVNGNTI